MEERFLTWISAFAQPTIFKKMTRFDQNYCPILDRKSNGHMLGPAMAPESAD
jgi:hypothetical protein